MINGLPGNVAKVITHHALQDPRVALLPYALTGPDIDADDVRIDGTDIALIQPNDGQARILSPRLRHEDQRPRYPEQLLEPRPDGGLLGRAVPYHPGELAGEGVDLRRILLRCLSQLVPGCHAPPDFFV